MRNVDSPSIWFFILVALVAHFALRNIPSPIGESAHSLKNLDLVEPPIVVENWIEERKPVVETEKNKETKLDLSAAKARFGGEFKNRVKKETQVGRTGKFRLGKKGSATPPRARRTDKTPKHSDGVPTGEIAIRMKDLLAYPGSQPFKLPNDVETGDRTMLNTDPVIYASFINRVREEVYGPWVDRVRRAVSNMRRLSSNDYITRIRIYVDPEGNLTQIDTLKRCGIKELDEAPRAAFWEAQPFPNPPERVVAKSNLDHNLTPFEFEFHFEYDASSFSVFGRI